MFSFGRCAGSCFVSIVAMLPCPAAKFEGIDSEAAAQAAVRLANPGDEIVLAGGKYEDWKLTIDRSGTAAAPITLRASQPGKVIFGGSTSFVVSGSHVQLHGLTFNRVEPDSKRSVVLLSGDNSRITEAEFRECRMQSGSPVVAIAGTASDCRIDHCQFIGVRYRSIRIVVDDSSLKRGPPVRTRIDHNVFRDIPRLGGNGAETIQIGSRAYPHSDLETSALVEDNVFIRCNGEAEIISDKTSGNMFRRNVFLECRGELVIRHGNRSTIVENRFIDCSGGIRLSGAGHVVTGNTIVNSSGTGIRLCHGVEDTEHPAVYLPVANCVIEGNTIINAGQAGLLVGANRNHRWHSERWAQKPYNASAHMVASIAPSGNRIRNNVIVGQSQRLIVIDDAPDNEFVDNLLVESPVNR